MLLQLAEREVFTQQLEFTRLEQALTDCASRELIWRTPRTLTPLSFPLWADSRRGELSTEEWKLRIERAAAQLEKRYAREP